MCTLIIAAHEHFITQAGKNSNRAFQSFMGPRGRGTDGGEPTYEAEGQEKQIPEKFM